MNSLKSAFNNINAVKATIDTQWGTISNADDNYAWSPEDVVIEATPGNDGNTFNAIFGSGGDVLLSATPLVNNWMIALHFLYKSKTYAQFSYLMQLVIENAKQGTKPGWFNFNLEDQNDPTDNGEHFYETLSSAQSMMITIPGKSWGARPSGDSTFVFLAANATYLAPGYLENEIPLLAGNMPLRNTQ